MVDDKDSLQYENQLAADEDSLFGSKLLQSGYRFSIARNLLFGLCIALVATFIWAVIILAEKYYKPYKNVRKSKSKEVFMSNLMTRFFIEAFFELMICSFINMSEQGGPGGSFWWAISLITVCCCIVGTLFVFSLYFKNGPYHKNSYVQGSLLKSSGEWDLLHPQNLLRNHRSSWAKQTHLCSIPMSLLSRWWLPLISNQLSSKFKILKVVSSVAPLIQKQPATQKGVQPLSVDWLLR